MARIKGAVNAHKRRRKVLKLAKGYFGAKSRQYRAANERIIAVEMFRGPDHIAMRTTGSLIEAPPHPWQHRRGHAASA